MVNGFNFGVGLVSMLVAQAMRVGNKNSGDMSAMIWIILLFLSGIYNFYYAFKEKKR